MKIKFIFILTSCNVASDNGDQQRKRTFRSGRFGLTVSVWAVSVCGHFGHGISVHKQLIAFVHLNDYIGRRNVMLAGVIPTPFEESWLRLNLNCNYEFEVIVFENVDNDLICLLMITKILCSCWLTVGSWIMFVFFLNTTIRWFKYVCIRKWTYKISPRFHSLTEMSRDRNDQDRKVPWPKRLRPNRPDWKVAYPTTNAKHIFSLTFTLCASAECIGS